MNSQWKALFEWYWLRTKYTAFFYVCRWRKNALVLLVYFATTNFLLHFLFSRIGCKLCSNFLVTCVTSSMALQSADTWIGSCSSTCMTDWLYLGYTLTGHTIVDSHLSHACHFSLNQSLNPDHACHFSLNRFLFITGHRRSDRVACHAHDEHRVPSFNTSLQSRTLVTVTVIGWKHNTEWLTWAPCRLNSHPLIQTSHRHEVVLGVPWRPHNHAYNVPRKLSSRLLGYRSDLTWCS